MYKSLNVVDSIVLLENEKKISKERITTRKKLINQLKGIPENAFKELQYFQPQINCLNRCAFCSQGAGTAIWQLGLESLEDLFSAIKTIAIDIAQNHVNDDGSPYVTVNHINGYFIMPSSGLLGYKRIHRPGVLFPYLDNDISLYPYLDKFIEYAYVDLGVKIRISTTGYSRLNPLYQEMHERINHQLSDAIAGIRFSITPYTYGWTELGKKNGKTSRDEFLKDVTNMLSTYKPIIDKLGISKEKACAELRFKPHVVTVSLEETFYQGHHVFYCGPYLFISKFKNQELPITKITGFNGQWPEFNNKGTSYIYTVSDQYLENKNQMEIAKKLIQNLCFNSESIEKKVIAELIGFNQQNFSISECSLFKFVNLDGYYYAIDPLIQEEGFYAKHFYPKTKSRLKSGYIDSERYFLNALIKFKFSKGLTRIETPLNVTYTDAQIILKFLSEKSIELSSYNQRASLHLDNNIIPLVETYINVMEQAKYPATFLFDKKFTIDTGQIVNQGRAITEFQGLVSKEDTPLTPQEERGYGDRSFSSLRGTVWRISLSPDYHLNQNNNSLGKKNQTNYTGQAIEISKLDCRNLYPVIDGNKPNVYYITGLAFEELKESNNMTIIPGSKDKR